MSDNVMMQISLVHIIFNVVSTIIMFPFAGALVKLSCILVPDKKGKEDDGMHLQFIDERMLNNPSACRSAGGKRGPSYGCFGKTQFRYCIKRPYKQGN